MVARLWFLFLLALVLMTVASAEQANPSKRAGGGSIRLDVVVAGKSGSPVGGLQQRDFTIFDNNLERNITSFQAVDGAKAPITTILVMDEVNADYATVGYERDEIDRFLRADNGHLACPTTLVAIMDTGLLTIANFSNDGNKIAGALDKYSASLRIFHGAGGYYDAAERFRISLVGLYALAQRESLRPGRKIMIWVSPGWPLLSSPEVLLHDKGREAVFSNIVDISTQLRLSRITLYTVDPEGTADSMGDDYYWGTFAKGVSKPRDARFGNLGLEVLSQQSGGLVLSLSNNIAELLRKCVADASAYYELSFDPPAGSGSVEYHRLRIHVAGHGLKARTWQGYYSGAALQSQVTIPKVVE